MNDNLHEPLKRLQRENVHLRDENQELREEVSMLRGVLNVLSALQEVTVTIDAHTDILKLMDWILQSALTSIHATDGSLMLVDEETNELAFVVVHGEMRETLVGHRIPADDGIAGWVAQNKEAVIIPNVRFDPRFSPEVDQDFHFYTRSMICVPIIYSEKVLGVIQAINKANGEEFTEADLPLLGVVAQLAATAISKAEAAVLEEEPV